MIDFIANIPRLIDIANPKNENRSELANKVKRALYIAQEHNFTQSTKSQNEKTTRAHKLDKNTATGALKAMKDNRRIDSIKTNSFQTAVTEWVNELLNNPVYHSTSQDERRGVYNNEMIMTELLEMIRAYVAVNLQYHYWAITDLVHGLPTIMEKLGISGWSAKRVVEENLDFISALQREFPDADYNGLFNNTKKIMENFGYYWDDKEKKYKKRQ